MEGEFAFDDVVVALGADGGGGEGGGGVLLGVEEVGGLDVASRSVFLVSMDATWISAVTAAVPSSATVIAPVKSLKVPRTLLTMRWRTEKPTVEWTVSMAQVPAVRLGRVAVAVVMKTPWAVERSLEIEVIESATTTLCRSRCNVN